MTAYLRSLNGQLDSDPRTFASQCFEDAHMARELALGFAYFQGIEIMPHKEVGKKKTEENQHIRSNNPEADGCGRKRMKKDQETTRNNPRPA